MLVGQNPVGCVMILLATSFLMTACESGAPSGPRVERIAVSGGRSAADVKPIKPDRPAWQSLSNVESIAGCCGRQPDRVRRLRMTEDAIKKAVIQSSLFKPEDHERVVREIAAWQAGQDSALAGLYTEVGGRFFIEFDADPRDRSKEVTLKMTRSIIPGGARGFFAVLQQARHNESCWFNEDGDLLDRRVSGWDE